MTLLTAGAGGSALDYSAGEAEAEAGAGAEGAVAEVTSIMPDLMHGGTAAPTSDDEPAAMGGAAGTGCEGSEHEAAGVAVAVLTAVVEGAEVMEVYHDGANMCGDSSNVQGAMSHRSTYSTVVEYPLEEEPRSAPWMVGDQDTASWIEAGADTGATAASAVFCHDFAPAALGPQRSSSSGSSGAGNPLADPDPDPDPEQQLQLEQQQATLTMAAELALQVLSPNTSPSKPPPDSPPPSYDEAMSAPNVADVVIGLVRQASSRGGAMQDDAELIQFCQTSLSCGVGAGEGVGAAEGGTDACPWEVAADALGLGLGGRRYSLSTVDEEMFSSLQSSFRSPRGAGQDLDPQGAGQDLDPYPYAADIPPVSSGPAQSAAAACAPTGDTAGPYAAAGAPTGDTSDPYAAAGAPTGDTAGPYAAAGAPTGDTAGPYAAGKREGEEVPDGGSAGHVAWLGAAATAAAFAGGAVEVGSSTGGEAAARVVSVVPDDIPGSMHIAAGHEGGAEGWSAPVGPTDTRGLTQSSSTSSSSATLPPPTGVSAALVSQYDADGGQPPDADMDGSMVVNHLDLTAAAESAATVCAADVQRGNECDPSTYTCLLPPAVSALRASKGAMSSSSSTRAALHASDSGCSINSSVRTEAQSFAATAGSEVNFDALSDTSSLSGGDAGEVAGDTDLAISRRGRAAGDDMCSTGAGGMMPGEGRVTLGAAGCGAASVAVAAAVVVGSAGREEPGFGGMQMERAGGAPTQAQASASGQPSTNVQLPLQPSPAVAATAGATTGAATAVAAGGDATASAAGGAATAAAAGGAAAAAAARNEPAKGGEPGARPGPGQGRGALGAAAVGAGMGAVAAGAVMATPGLSQGANSSCSSAGGREAGTAAGVGARLGAAPVGGSAAGAAAATAVQQQGAFKVRGRCYCWGVRGRRSYWGVPWGVPAQPILAIAWGGRSRRVGQRPGRQRGVHQPGGKLGVHRAAACEVS